LNPTSAKWNSLLLAALVLFLSTPRLILPGGDILRELWDTFPEKCTSPESFRGWISQVWFAARPS